MIIGLEKAASAVAGFVGRALRPAARAASKTIRPLAASTNQLSIPADLLKNYGRVAELLPKAKAVLPGQHPVIGAATNAISRLGSAPGGYERFQHLFQNLIPDLEKYIQRALRRSAIASEGSAL